MLITRKKTLGILAAIIAYAVLMLLLASKPSTHELYAGMNININIIFLLLALLHFTIYSFIFFESTKKYIREYGILVLTRHRSRFRLWVRFYIRMLQVTVILETLIVICYILFSMIFARTFVFGNVADSLSYYLSTILFFMLLLSLQLVIEIFYSSSTGVLVSQGIFIVTVIISGIILNRYPNSLINHLFLNNYAMSLRSEELDISIRMKYFISLAEFFVYYTFIFVAGWKKFRRNDLL
jgi:hypothetical protein